MASTVPEQAVLADSIVAVTGSQQMPEVQQPGLSLLTQMPKPLLHETVWQTVAGAGQSPSTLQHPGCGVPTQRPVPSHWSLAVQALLSLQKAPIAALHLLVDLVGSHTWQLLAWEGEPSTTHCPSMKHQPPLAPRVHWPDPGSQTFS